MKTISKRRLGYLALIDSAMELDFVCNQLPPSPKSVFYWINSTLRGTEVLRPDCFTFDSSFGLAPYQFIVEYGNATQPLEFATTLSPTTSPNLETSSPVMTSSSPIITSSPDSSNPSSNSVDQAVIIGSVVGGVAFLLIILALLFLFFLRRRRRDMPTMEEKPSEASSLELSLDSPDILTGIEIQKEIGNVSSSIHLI